MEQIIGPKKGERSKVWSRNLDGIFYKRFFFSTKFMVKVSIITLIR